MILSPSGFSGRGCKAEYQNQCSLLWTSSTVLTTPYVHCWTCKEFCAGGVPSYTPIIATVSNQRIIRLTVWLHPCKVTMHFTKGYSTRKKKKSLATVDQDHSLRFKHSAATKTAKRLFSGLTIWQYDCIHVTWQCMLQKDTDKKKSLAAVDQDHSLRFNHSAVTKTAQRLVSEDNRHRRSFICFSQFQKEEIRFIKLCIQRNNQTCQLHPTLVLSSLEECALLKMPFPLYTVLINAQMPKIGHFSTRLWMNNAPVPRCSSKS